MASVPVPPPSHMPVVVSLQSLAQGPALSPTLQLEKQKQIVQVPVWREREQRGCGVGSQEGNWE